MNMERLISIQATKFALTDAIKEYVFKKIFSLEKFIHAFDADARVFVEVGLTTRHHHKGDVYHAEIQILPPLSQKGLRAEAEEADVYKAIDKAKDEIKKELVSAHGKDIARNRSGARMVKKLTVR